MKTWVLLAIVAYTLNAINGVIDKFLLSGPNRRPIAYAFYSSILSFLIVLGVPFGATFPQSFVQVLVSVVGGFAFTLALVFLYEAIQRASISRILPIQGGLIPVFTLLFAFYFLDERLRILQYAAFCLLVVGAVMMSIKRDEESGILKLQAFSQALVASIFFAVSYVASKYLYDQVGLLNGLIWTRVAMGVSALIILMVPSFRKSIFITAHTGMQNKKLFYTSKFVGSIAGLLENTAIALGSVTIVKALQGTQYVFLLALTSFLTIYFPAFLKEKITRSILILKLSAIALITVGLILLNY